jgi:hypothetical protein
VLAALALYSFGVVFGFVEGSFVYLTIHLIKFSLGFIAGNLGIIGFIKIFSLSFYKKCSTPPHHEGLLLTVTKRSFCIYD